MHTTETRGSKVPFKAVICDLDGTLLDSLEDLADAANVALAELGYPEHPVPDYKRFVGNGVQMLIQRALPQQARTEAIIARCVALFGRAYQRGWNAKSVPYAGIPALLDWLRADGIALAVLSNKPDSFTREIVGYYFSGWEFQPVQGAVEDFPKKPDPAGAVRIAKSLGLAPREIVFLGDSDVDMRTAKNAGMFAAGALWGFREAAELQQAGADVLLEEPLALRAWLSESNGCFPEQAPERFNGAGRVPAAQ